MFLETTAEIVGFESPEAIFSNLVEASNAKDFNKLCKSFAPDNTATINTVMIAGPAIIVTFAKMAADIPSGADSAKSDAEVKDKEKNPLKR